jgi:REP element-mobilizing transposase RayT
MTTNEYLRNVKNKGWKPLNGKLWQRNYYEHIIRNEDELNLIREYIQHNPLKWDDDKENLDVIRILKSQIMFIRKP